MNSFTIRNYKPEDHKELLRVFKSHFNVAIKTGTYYWWYENIKSYSYS